MKIISNTNQIVTRGLVAFFVSLGLIVGVVPPANAGTDNGTNNWHKSADVQCLTYDGNYYLLHTPLSNFDIATKPGSSASTWQRYHFKMDYYTTSNEVIRPRAMSIDGVYFSNWYYRSGTLYDGYVDLPGNGSHTLRFWWEDRDNPSNPIDVCGRTYNF